MADTTFVNKATLTDAGWFNDVNAATYRPGSGIPGVVLANARSAIARNADFPSVKDFGAKGDGVTDDTLAINTALSSLTTGGVMLFPMGQYLISSKITIPNNVLMRGETWLPDPSNFSQTHMTSIYVNFGSGASPGTGSHAVELSVSSGIEGFTFYYPGQVAKTASTPTSFDYSISTPVGGSTIDNCSVKNITFYNSYAGVNLSNGGRWHVENLQGDPLFIGFKADQCFDVCYMRAVHFWNFYTQGAALESWVANNCTAFLWGRIDQLFGSDLFAWNVNVAYSCGTNFWGTLSNILSDKANTNMLLAGHAQVQVDGYTFIGNGSVMPHIWIQSGGTAAFANGKHTTAGSVGCQVDGSTSVSFSNTNFGNQHSALVCTSTTTKVTLDPSCAYTIPPFGPSNVIVAGAALPFQDANITLPSPTTSPTTISGGYSFDLTTVGTRTLQYDITTIAQRNSLYIFQFTYELTAIEATWNFQFSVDHDIGGQLQVNFQPTYPLLLAGTSGSPKVVYVPFFVNGCTFKTLLSLIVNATVGVPNAALKVTNISLWEEGNKHITDEQVAMMLRQGYNQDFYGVGASLMAKGANRKVYPVLDSASGRTTEVPTAGAWAVGDEVVTLVPASAGFIGRVCTVTGTPGTWKTFGVIS